MSKKIKESRGEFSGVCDGLHRHTAMIERYGRQGGFPCWKRAARRNQADKATSRKFGFAMGPFRMGDAWQTTAAGRSASVAVDRPVACVTTRPLICSLRDGCFGPEGRQGWVRLSSRQA